MAKLSQHIKNARHFGENLWSIRLDKVSSKKQSYLLKTVRVLALSVKGFNEDKCFTRASALTYYILLSIVPILALAFAIAKGFGLEQDLQKQILEENVRYQDVLTQVFDYANRLLDNTKGALIGGVGVVLLLWSVISLLNNIENTFNDIWNIRSGRSWFRKITDYLAIMLISPICLILSGSITVMIQTHTSSSQMILSEASVVLVHLLSFVFICGMFVLLYMIMPNTKVHFRSALFAACFSAVFFELLKWAYVAFQVGVSRFNAIYGSFAALPLFLIFVQYAWYVVLYGAEIAYSIQNVNNFELASEVKKLSVRYKRVMALLICSRIVKKFLAGEKPMQLEQISHELDLPNRLAKMMITDLVEVGVLSEVRVGHDKYDIAYQPGVSDSVMTVKYVIDKLDHRGVNELPISTSEELEMVHRVMADLDTSMSNEKGNMLIRDIS